MKQLWAPWRMQYIESAPEKKTNGCPLCAAPASLDRSDNKASASVDSTLIKPAPPQTQADSLLLYKGAHTSVIMNKYPYSNGHLMVSPLAHTADLGSLAVQCSIELFDMIKVSIGILKECMNPDGFNIGMNLGKAAGAGIEDHLHMHIVPRWNGDTNFMSVLSEVRVMPEHLQATYAKLRPFFDAL